MNYKAVFWYMNNRWMAMQWKNKHWRWAKRITLWGDEEEEFNEAFEDVEEDAKDHLINQMWSVTTAMKWDTSNRSVPRRGMKQKPLLLKLKKSCCWWHMWKSRENKSTTHGIWIQAVAITWVEPRRCSPNLFRENVNDSSLKAQGKWDVKIEVNGVVQIISSVFYVPELRSNMISLGQLQEKGFAIPIQKNCCQIHQRLNYACWNGF